jgi:hypothetical protein
MLIMSQLFAGRQTGPSLSAKMISLDARKEHLTRANIGLTGPSAKRRWLWHFPIFYLCRTLAAIENKQNKNSF